MSDTGRKYTPATRNKILRQLRLGRTIAELHRRFKVARGTITRWCREAAGAGKPVLRSDGTPVIKSHNHYDQAQKAEILRLVDQGYSIYKVARHFNMPPTTIHWWLKEMGQKQPRRVIGMEELKPALAILEEEDRELKRSRKAHRDAERALAQSIPDMVADPLTWMQKHTETKDSHWRERGARTPYRPFPDKPYFRPAIEDWQREPVVFIEKSRNMMLSWLCVGFFTHAAMTTPGIEILFQSQKEDKAFELVDYAKVLYDHQSDDLKEAFPLVKKLKDMADGELLFANGSRIVGIPGGADQIRSYHPWGLLMDEAAFMPEAGDSYNNAVPVCRKILMVSSAGPGWFADTCNSAVPLPNSYVRGFSRKQSPLGLIQRIHYSADSERGPEWVAEERKKYSSQGAWDREQEIVHEAGGGERIFAEVLSRYEDKILIDPAESGFQVSPHWKRIAAFDHGKANPTAALVAAMDCDGNLYILSEYYQPGLSPRQHRPNLMMLDGFMQSEALADPSIFYKSQAQSDGTFKAINDLYIQEGITNLVPAPNNSEETGMERILNHLLDLGNREPTLRIVCPRRLRDISKPIYGVHNEGCPNMLWELKRARREELSAGQLLRKNPTEKIVDRDNHLRDCLKYLCLAFVEPPKPTPEMIANEAIKDIPKDDPTSRMIRWNDAYEKAKEAERPVYIPLGRRGLYLELKRKAREMRRMKNLFRDPGERG